jgi:hypothetical protein
MGRDCLATPTHTPKANLANEICDLLKLDCVFNARFGARIAASGIRAFQLFPGCSNLLKPEIK